MKNSAVCSVSMLSMIVRILSRNLSVGAGLLLVSLLVLLKELKNEVVNDYVDGQSGSLD